MSPLERGPKGNAPSVCFKVTRHPESYIRPPVRRAVRTLMLNVLDVLAASSLYKALMMRCLPFPWLEKESVEHGPIQGAHNLGTMANLA